MVKRMLCLFILCTCLFAPLATLANGDTTEIYAEITWVAPGLLYTMQPLNPEDGGPFQVNGNTTTMHVTQQPDIGSRLIAGINGFTEVDGKRIADAAFLREAKHYALVRDYELAATGERVLSLYMATQQPMNIELPDDYTLVPVTNDGTGIQVIGYTPFPVGSYAFTDQVRAEDIETVPHQYGAVASFGTTSLTIYCHPDGAYLNPNDPEVKAAETMTFAITPETMATLHLETGGQVFVAYDPATLEALAIFYTYG